MVLNSIVEAVASIDDSNQQIAVVTREQQTTSSEIGQRAESIYQIAESSAAKTDSAHECTSRLQQRAGEMSQAVEQFIT